MASTYFMLPAACGDHRQGDRDDQRWLGNQCIQRRGGIGIVALAEILRQRRKVDRVDIPFPAEISIAPASAGLAVMARQRIEVERIDDAIDVAVAGHRDAAGEREREWDGGL